MAVKLLEDHAPETTTESALIGLLANSLEENSAVTKEGFSRLTTSITRVEDAVVQAASDSRTDQRMITLALLFGLLALAGVGVSTKYLTLAPTQDTQNTVEASSNGK